MFESLVVVGERAVGDSSIWEYKTAADVKVKPSARVSECRSGRNATIQTTFLIGHSTLELVIPGLHGGRGVH